MILRWKESQVLFAYNYTFQLHRPTCHKLDFMFDIINILFCKYGFALERDPSSLLFANNCSLQFDYIHVINWILFFEIFSNIYLFNYSQTNETTGF